MSSKALQPTQLVVKKLDPTKLKPHRLFLLLGRRGSGKSVLLRDILYNSRDRFDYVMAMCPTMESSSMLKQCMPESCVFERFYQSKLDALVKTASELAAAGKCRHFALVLDDVMYDKTVCKSESFRFLFYNGRHVKITCILLLQYLVDLPPDMRAQIDYVFTMKENTIQNRIKLWKMFFGVFSTLDEFSAVLENCTQNDECLCLDNTAESTLPVDCVFWYKARLAHPPFNLGRKVFYELELRHKRTTSVSRQGTNAVASCVEDKSVSDVVATSRSSSKAQVLVVKEEGPNTELELQSAIAEDDSVFEG